MKGCIFLHSFYTCNAAVLSLLLLENLVFMSLCSSINFCRSGRALMLLSGLVLLAGCATATAPMGGREYTEKLQNDLAVAVQKTDHVMRMTLDEALDLAVKRNLDVQVALMEELIRSGEYNIEKLSLLPHVEIGGSYQGRNNAGASSSRSALTGVQSLEPSVSTDRHRRTMQLETSWNILDAAVTVAHARTASDRVLIAHERRRKVLQNLAQDVYVAFWRAAAEQETAQKHAALLKEADQRLADLEQALKKGALPHESGLQKKEELLRKRNALAEKRRGVAQAMLELKTLLGLSPQDRVELRLPQKNWLTAGSFPKLEQDIEQLQETALMNRPEIKEAFLKERIALRDIKSTVLETLPGARFFLGLNKDSNSFLSDQDWTNFSVSLSATLMDLFTLPQRYEHAKNKKTLSDKQRYALLVAVIAQVHVAKQQLEERRVLFSQVDEQSGNYKKILRSERRKRDAGLGSDLSVLNTELDYALLQWDRISAYQTTQHAYARMLNSLGVDVWQDAGNEDEAKKAKKDQKHHLTQLDTALQTTRQ